MPKFLANIASATLEQIALTSYLRSGSYDRHLHDRRIQYALNAGEMLNDIHEHFPAGTQTSYPQGGITAWVQLPGDIDTLALTEQCLHKGIGIFPGQVFSSSGRYCNCLRLSYASPYGDRARQGIQQIAALAKKQLS